MNRLFVEKKSGYNLEALTMLSEIKDFLKIKGVNGVRVLYRYDVEGLNQSQFELISSQIFVDTSTEVSYNAEYIPEGNIIAIEYLAGQYDQRTDYAMQIAKIIVPECADKLLIKVSKVFVIIGNVTKDDISTIKSYYINSVESIESSTKIPKTLKTNYLQKETVETISDFTNMDAFKLGNLKKKHSINMGMDDLLFCQNYFIKENRQPTVTELKIFDTYWSDHCRHSTFMTVIDDIIIEQGNYSSIIKDALNKYYTAKKQVSSNKPVCLMDIAVMGMKKLAADGKLDDMEISDEVNACSIVTDVVIDGNTEQWLFMFKNETHNHPTEIEPFGGASTCLGGGIRDPLSGRAYVHGAIRLTGCANPLTPYKDTLKGKLPQRKLTKTAAEGYSSYANQIGLASGHLAEIYDDGFAAKRLECGALVAAVKKENVIRMSPVEGDAIVLLGGNTGADGIGGATGSSREHDETSLSNGGAEVQKGNPIIERNIVRLFRDPIASKMIKKCNDFGAGGVSVAVCEMADSLKIDLDAVPLKYDGMDGTEIAISESQERMACLLSSDDLSKFIELANKENLQCVKIADVTADNRVKMYWKGKIIADISSEMLSSGGVRQHTTISVSSPDIKKLNLISPLVKVGSKKIKENFINNVTDLNVCSKIGIANRFDTTASANTVLMPYGGKYQKTYEQGLCMKFPAKVGKCDTATLMTLGYNPKISPFSPFHQAMYAVLESVNKIVVMGGNTDKIRLSFQEYFERLGNNPTRWGKPFAALLGAFLAQEQLQIPSIGGKDSMSGTFLDIDVPPSLISFAVSTANVANVVSAAFKNVGNKVIKVYANIDNQQMPDFAQFRNNMQAVNKLIKQSSVYAGSAVGFGGIAATVFNMCQGNGLGFEFADAINDNELYSPDYTAMLLEVSQTADLSQLTYKELGTITDTDAIAVNKEKIPLSDIAKAAESTLSTVFPTNFVAKVDSKAVKADYYGKTIYPKVTRKAKPTVLIPVFPGSNGEYELEKGFIEAGAEVKSVVFISRTTSLQEQSIKQLANEIDNADIFAIPSGMSAGCEPIGSAKLISTILNRQPVKEALTRLIDDRNGLVLGIGEGFNALVKVGLLPYGKFTDSDIVIEKNAVDKYMCQFVNTRVSSVNSPWMTGINIGDIYKTPLSTLEGRIVLDTKSFNKLSADGQIISQYVNNDGKPSINVEFNPCGADYAVECMASKDGRILGKMTNFERVSDGLYKNIPNVQLMPLLYNAVQYFKQSTPKVAVMMGSDSDYKVVGATADIFNKFGVEFEMRVLSAHRTPQDTAEYVKGLKNRGIKVVIAAAGKAAHLAGAVAANTTLPVIGIPINSTATAGLDALLATVQMPSGIPVATVALDGAENAALLAIQILATSDNNLSSMLEASRQQMVNTVKMKNQALQNKLSEQK